MLLRCEIQHLIYVGHYFLFVSLILPSPQTTSDSAVCLRKIYRLSYNRLIINIDKFLQRGRVLNAEPLVTESYHLSEAVRKGCFLHIRTGRLSSGSRQFRLPECASERCRSLDQSSVPPNPTERGGLPAPCLPKTPILFHFPHPTTSANTAASVSRKRWHKGCDTDQENQTPLP